MLLDMSETLNYMSMYFEAKQTIRLRLVSFGMLQYILRLKERSYIGVSRKVSMIGRQRYGEMNVLLLHESNRSQLESTAGLSLVRNDCQSAPLSRLCPTLDTR